MNEYTDEIGLGPAPAEESCAQTIDPDYHSRAKVECKAYIEAIRKKLGREPEGARLRITSNPHDFGSYYETAIRYDANNEKAAEYARRCDEEAPTTWEEVGMSPPERNGLVR